MRRVAKTTAAEAGRIPGAPGQDVVPRYSRPGRAAVGILLGAGSMALVSLAVLTVMSAIPWQYAVPGIVVLSLVLLLSLSVLVRRCECALVQGEQRERVLAMAVQHAKQVADAESQARERQEKATQHLRQAVRECNAFLERASNGDYSPLTGPAIGSMEEDEELAADLQAMIDGLNSVVAAMATALQGVQPDRAGYPAGGWSGSAQASRCLGLCYRDGIVETANDAWLESMQAAVQERNAVTSGGELALPISWKGRTIGAIGLRRQRDEGWHEEEVVFAQVVVDQLAQTLENLSLLDQAQRHAVHDKLIRRISERLQGAADMESLLQTALREAAAAVGASRAFVQWVPVPNPIDDGTL